MRRRRRMRTLAALLNKTLVRVSRYLRVRYPERGPGLDPTYKMYHMIVQ